MKPILSLIFIVAVCLNPIAASAQTAAPAKKFDLTIDNIMRGPDLVGYAPTGVRWSPDNKMIYFSWKRAGEPQNANTATYEVNADGSGLRKLTEDEAKQTVPPNGDLSDDKRSIVYSDAGDIFLYDTRSGERRQITKTADAEGSPRFIGDQRSISFTRQNNLYTFSLDKGLLEQVTDIRAAGGAAAGPGGGRNQDTTKKGTDSQETLKKEERELLDFIRERAEKREADVKKRKV
ncbi:MAG: TolB family protein, partial [Pyrinomonadaceae bacterium]